MCVLFVNAFAAVEELWEGLEMATALILCRHSWLLYAASLARTACEVSIYLYNPGHLGVVDEVRADWLFLPFTGEMWVSLSLIYIYYMYI